MDKEKIFVFDTTLRDGEQAAGLRLDSIEKLEIACQLTKLNVDIIEAGFPISSQEDFKAVELISKEIKGPVITGLTRAVPKDIDVCAKALEKAAKPRIHTGMGVSDIHILGKFKDKKYGKSLKEKKDKIFQMSVNAAKIAKKYVMQLIKELTLWVKLLSKPKAKVILLLVRELLLILLKQVQKLI